LPIDPFSFPSTIGTAEDILPLLNHDSGKFPPPSGCNKKIFCSKH